MKKKPIKKKKREKLGMCSNSLTGKCAEGYGNGGTPGSGPQGRNRNRNAQ